MAVPAYVTVAIAATEKPIESDLLGTLRQRSAALTDARRRLTQDAQNRGSALKADESRAHQDLVERETQLLARVAELEATQGRDALAAQSRANLGVPTGSGWSVGSEPGIYRGEHDGPSFVRDLVNLATKGYAPDASERMHRHMTGMQAENRALSTTDGSGGDFVPPLWMVDKYVKLARAGRVTADRMHKDVLPTGTDNINVPKLATGTAVAEQTTQNTTIQNTDATTSSVSASVLTFAGAQTVALQAIEQSPINLDAALLEDLAGAYATQLNTAILTRNTAGGLGMLGAGLSGINAVTYTDASPTGGELYPKLNDAIQRIATARFRGADSIVMHPRRWAWLLSQLDSQGRPLVVPYAGGPVNAIAAMEDGAPAEGYVGVCLGLPTFVDSSIPINLGAGTNEDRILIAKFSDGWLLEGTPRLESFRDTKADTLAAYLRFYNYAAFTWQRYPSSISVVSGTGLVTPSF